MAQQNITNAVGIHSYYADRILNIMRNINATPIVWQDVLDEKVAVSVALTTIRMTVSLEWVPVAIGHDHSSLERCRRYLGILSGQCSQKRLQRHSVNTLVLELYQLRQIQYGDISDESGVFQVL